jgi:hypothetical protein
MEFRKLEKDFMDAARKKYLQEKADRAAEIVIPPNNKKVAKFLNQKIPSSWIPKASISNAATDVCGWVAAPKRDSDYNRMFPYTVLPVEKRTTLMPKFKDFTNPLMAMQADQLVMNHCLHRHPATVFTTMEIYSDLQLVSTFNKWTKNFYAMVCLMYGLGSWSSSIPSKAVSLKALQKHSREQYDVAMEMLSHIIQYYSKLDEGNPWACQILVADITKANVRQFIDNENQKVQFAVVGPAFLVDKKEADVDPHYDTDFEEENDSDDDSHTGVGMEKIWLQGAYLPNVQLLVSINKTTRDKINLDNKSVMFLTENELAVLSNTPALFGIQGGDPKSATREGITVVVGDTETPQKRSNDQFQSLSRVMRKTRKSG